MKAASELRPGAVLRIGGDLFRVLSAEHHLGGGKMPGSVHVKLRNVRTTHVTERRFRPEERVEEVNLDKRVVEFLYEDGSDCVFMDPQSFEQIPIPRESLGPFLPFLRENQSLHVGFLDGQPAEVIWPQTVVLRVTSTAEPTRGQHDSNVMKSATLENGISVLVPPFVKTGDQVKIDVESGKYVERAK